MIEQLSKLLGFKSAAKTNAIVVEKNLSSKTADKGTVRYINDVRMAVKTLTTAVNILKAELIKSNKKIDEMSGLIKKYNPGMSPGYITGDLKFTEEQIAELRKHNITIEQYMKNLEAKLKSDILSPFRNNVNK